MSHNAAIYFCIFSFIISNFLLLAYYKMWRISSDWIPQKEKDILKIKIGPRWNFQPEGWYVIIYIGVFYIEFSSHNFKYNLTNELENS